MKPKDHEVPFVYIKDFFLFFMKHYLDNELSLSLFISGGEFN